MCGICGIVRFSPEPVREASLCEMMRAMKHRGPDDEGIFLEGRLGLGFVRLSIIDLSAAGHQPMISLDSRHVVVLNGEIYNYIELRRELATLGYAFKTRTDTEVLLCAYQEWGADCLHRLNGMWAFAIYDRIERKLFCARDRFGVKPFYYVLNESGFLFASEIPPILKVIATKPGPDSQAIYDYLVFNRTDQAEGTFFDSIKKLQHGHVLTMNLDKGESQGPNVDIRKWYDLRANLKPTFRNPGEFRETLSSAIGLRLRSDVPVGVCLSGGIDSSSIASILVKDHEKSHLHTFSAVYQKGDHGDESEFIDEFIPILSNMHRVYPTAESFLNDLHPFVKTQCEPIPSTGVYAQYKVMEMAKSSVSVILDGQGADEQLAGYHYFFGFYFRELFTHLRWLRLASEMATYYRQHHALYGFGAFAYTLLPGCLKDQASVVKKGYIDRNFIHEYSRTNRIINDLYTSKSLHESLLDHFEFKLDHLLKWEDRNSMRFSIEARVPFLDYRLVEKTLSLPPDKVLRDGTTKFILREAMKGILPEKIRARSDKVGFDTPQEEWFKKAIWRNAVNEILQSRSFAGRGMIDPKAATDLFQAHVSGKINAAKEIWKCVHLEIWFREFIDA